MPEPVYPVNILWPDQIDLKSFAAFVPAQILKPGGNVAASVILTPGDESQVQLEEGPYLIRAQLPSGLFSNKQFTVEKDTAGQTVELQFVKRRTRLLPSQRTSPNAPIPNLSESSVSGDMDESGPVSFYDYIDSTTPKVEDSSDLPIWSNLWIRLWNFVPGSGWNHVELSSKLSKVSFDGEALVLRWLRKPNYLDNLYPFYIELGGASTLSRFTAVPPCLRCDLVIRTSNLPTAANGWVTLRIIGSDPVSVRSQALLQYLQTGAFDAASATFDQLAVSLLNSDEIDPFGATVGSYFILKTGRFKGTDNWFRIGQMLEMFETNFSNLPDTALLCAWFNIEDEDSKDRPASISKAKAMLLKAAERGVPLFVLGLRYLVDTLRVLASDPSAAPGNIQKLNEGISILGRYAQAADDSQVMTTFFAHAPWIPDSPVPPIAAETVSLAPFAAS